MKNSPELLIDAKNMLGEGPLWCPRTRALWWIDVQRPTLFRWSHSTAETRSWPLPKPPGTFALLEDGGLFIVFRSRFALLAHPDAELEWLDSPRLSLGDERFNDGKVDRLGRLWVGTMDRTLSRPIGRLYRLGPDGSVVVVDSGFTLSNGIGWSPDDRVLYFAETRDRRIHRYDFDLETGAVSDRSVLVELPEGPGGPDGLTVDAAGFVWCALFERGCVNRYSPSGTLDRSIPLPVSRPTSCAIGGPDMRTLFVTTARYGLSESALEAEPGAGGVYRIDLEEHGVIEPCFNLGRSAPSSRASAA